MLCSCAPLWHNINEVKIAKCRTANSVHLEFQSFEIYTKLKLISSIFKPVNIYSVLAWVTTFGYSEFYCPVNKVTAHIWLSLILCVSWVSNSSDHCGKFRLTWEVIFVSRLVIVLWSSWIWGPYLSFYAFFFDLYGLVRYLQKNLQENHAHIWLYWYCV